MQKELTGDQKTALNGLLTSIRKLSEQSTDKKKQMAPQVLAIIGPRGIGKTTILTRLLEQLATNCIFAERQVFPAKPIDAATVMPDQGILAAAMHALYNSHKKSDTDCHLHDECGLARRPYSSQPPPADRKLEEAFKKCLSLAFNMEQSHRELALELAMSSGHYAEIIREGAEMRTRIPRSLDDFLRVLHCDSGKNPLIIVPIDDLDLAEASSIRNWARGVLTDWNSPLLCWIVIFDRDTLTEALARPNIRSSDHAFSNSHEPVSKLDLVSGRALLDKLIPAEHQFELRRIPSPERLRFTSLADGFSTKDGEILPNPLQELIAASDESWLFPLLPSDARGLNGLYHLLAKRDQRSEAGKLLRQTLLLRGELRLIQEIDRRGIEGFISSLHWGTEAGISDPAWGVVAEAAARESALWGLPLPRRLIELTEGDEPESLLEGLFDFALLKGILTPYDVLLRMPATSERITKARCRLVFSKGSELDSLFNEARRSGHTNDWLLWQIWDSSPDPHGGWPVENGYKAFCDAVSGLRTLRPEALLRSLVMRDFPVPLADYPDILPRSTRALVLLTGGLMQVPWSEIENGPAGWKPLTFTLVTAAAILSSYSAGLAVKEKTTHPLDIASSRTLAPLRCFSSEEIADLYAEFHQQIGQLTGTESKKTENSPLTVARKNLADALLRALEPSRKLIPEPGK